jgi:hypothetical protein
MSFKRRVLSALGRDELLEIGRGLELDVTTRMGVDDLRDALAKSKRANLATIVVESLPRETLKEICLAVGLDDAGKEKASLVQRILAASSKNGDAAYKIDAAKARGSVAREGVAPFSTGTPALAGLLNAKPKTKAAKKNGANERRRGGVSESESVVAGTLKAALQQFALTAAGGYTGNDGHIAFTTHLLECFRWNAGRPDGAEIPKVFSIADAGHHVEREVALWWPERRTLMEVAAHDAVLDFAWKDLVRVCLQLDPIPQYVVLTNQRDLHLYDLARDRDTPRLAIRMDDLPKYSEAFPFFTTEWKPGAVPKIVNVEKVSGEVADLVARLYRSVRAHHPKRERDVIRFTLQCITAMFAEDIGLMPKNYFTTLLYDGAKRGNVEQRIRELFEQMNTRNLPGRVVPYFNGGLFTDAVTLPLGPDQVIALTKAAEANWTYVDPHIFGSVFQGIMDDAERHAQGAHYTAQDDIMRVVGPTIVEPWRKRIQSASSLKELTELRRELLAYRVLDPACGSGNFLYVAFRELYRLDTELLSRMREYSSTKSKVSWTGGLSAINFYGIDINPFAVELAKVTLNIAKKIAYEERKAQAFALAGQVEMDMDPSLPLDNLDKNIVCADALFTNWPEADAIVGNPPMLGGLKIRGELGLEYLQKLQAAFPEVNGRADFCAYWFRHAHERLLQGGRAGLVATNSVREGPTKEAATDFIVANGGTITNAVSSREWPGEAVLHVSMVNGTKGQLPGPFTLIVDEQAYELSTIPPHLQLHADLRAAKAINANLARLTTAGVQWGTKGFQIDGATAQRLMSDVRARKAVRPVVTGTQLLTGKLDSSPDYVVDLSFCADVGTAKKFGAAFTFLEKEVRPEILEKGATFEGWEAIWWQHWRPRRDFFRQVEGKARFIACSRHAARPVFVFLSTAFVPNDSMQIFAFDDDYSFGIIQSNVHWWWAVAQGTKIKDDTRYTADVWATFPWPQAPTDEQVAAVATASRSLRVIRARLMEQNAWSLRALYQAADVEGSHPLKDAQAALDAAVADAYGMPPDQSSTEFLLELNQLVAEDEEQGHKVRGPGLPEHLDSKDRRWMSTDCIQPPRMES